MRGPRHSTDFVHSREEKRRAPSFSLPPDSVGLASVAALGTSDRDTQGRGWTPAQGSPAQFGAGALDRAGSGAQP